MSSGPTRLRALLESIEFTRGHDGFLRGKPEPEILFALYAISTDSAVLLQRNRRPVAVNGAYPTTTELPNKLMLNSRVPSGCRRLALLCLALEHDSGEDINTIYAGLVEDAAWQVRACDSALAAPFSLPELLFLQPTPAPAALPVELKLRGDRLEDLCQKDDWVGAGLLLLDGETDIRDLWRLRILSSSQRNDWTLKIEVRV